MPKKPEEEKLKSFAFCLDFLNDNYYIILNNIN